jgi:hypothetical protein
MAFQEVVRKTMLNVPNREMASNVIMLKTWHDNRLDLHGQRLRKVFMQSCTRVIPKLMHTMHTLLTLCTCAA